jgi:hypothetical protein
MDFDGIETHPIFLKTLTVFDGNLPIKTSFRNQDLIQPFCLSLNLPPKGIFKKNVSLDNYPHLSNKCVSFAIIEFV